jgi:hypothetical protein
MSTKINPFGKQASERSCLDILQESFGIGIREYDRGAEVWDEDSGKWVWNQDLKQECVIEFAVNEGKGTGRQTIPASEFRSYVDALQAILDSGFQEPSGADRTAYVPTNVVAAQSFKMVSRTDGGERNVVSLRCTSGKGAKPMQVRKEEFSKVVDVLQGISESLVEYEEQAWKNYNGE